MASARRTILVTRVYAVVIRRAGAFLHASKVNSRRIVASNAGSLHAAVVHFLYAKGRRAAVALGTFIARHSGRGDRRNMVGRFRHDIGVGTAVAGLASSRHDSGMVEGSRQPVGKTVVARLARCCRRQMAGRLYVDVGISAAMTVAATGGGDTRMRIWRDQRQPGKPGPMAGVAGLGSRDMRGRFAACINVVVTIDAGSRHNPDVGKAGGPPGGRRMASVAG